MASVITELFLPVMFFLANLIYLYGIYVVIIVGAFGVMMWHRFSASPKEIKDRKYENIKRGAADFIIYIGVVLPILLLMVFKYTCTGSLDPLTMRPPHCPFPPVGDVIANILGHHMLMFIFGGFIAYVPIVLIAFVSTIFWYRRSASADKKFYRSRRFLLSGPMAVLYVCLLLYVIFMYNNFIGSPMG